MEKMQIGCFKKKKTSRSWELGQRQKKLKVPLCRRFVVATTRAHAIAQVLQEIHSLIRFLFLFFIIYLFFLSLSHFFHAIFCCCYFLFHLCSLIYLSVTPSFLIILYSIPLLSSLSLISFSLLSFFNFQRRRRRGSQEN